MSPDETYRLVFIDKGVASNNGNGMSSDGSKGYGQVKGQIIWQYNKVLGTRGDNGAHVMLIPKNDTVKNYDNKNAATLISGKYGISK